MLMAHHILGLGGERAQRGEMARWIPQRQGVKQGSNNYQTKYLDGKGMVGFLRLHSTHTLARP